MVTIGSDFSKILTTGVAVALASGFAGFYFGANSSSVEIVDDEEEDYEVHDQAGGEPCKMVLIVRKDLPMTKGKIAAQCAHAALACYEKAIERTPQNVISWKSQGQAKIALQVDSLEELRKLQMRAARLGVVAEHIVDAGRTQIDPGSTTVLGLGPAPIPLINEISGHLKLL